MSVTAVKHEPATGLQLEWPMVDECALRPVHTERITRRNTP